MTSEEPAAASTEAAPAKDEAAATGQMVSWARYRAQGMSAAAAAGLWRPPPFPFPPGFLEFPPAFVPPPLPLPPGGYGVRTAAPASAVAPYMTTPPAAHPGCMPAAGGPYQPPFPGPPGFLGFPPTFVLPAPGGIPGVPTAIASALAPAAARTLPAIATGPVPIATRTAATDAASDPVSSPTEEEEGNRSRAPEMSRQNSVSAPANEEGEGKGGGRTRRGKERSSKANPKQRRRRRRDGSAEEDKEARRRRIRLPREANERVDSYGGQYVDVSVTEWPGALSDTESKKRARKEQGGVEEAADDSSTRRRKKGRQGGGAEEEESEGKFLRPTEDSRRFYVGLSEISLQQARDILSHLIRVASSEAGGITSAREALYDAARRTVGPASDGGGRSTTKKAREAIVVLLDDRKELLRQALEERHEWIERREAVEEEQRVNNQEKRGNTEDVEEPTETEWNGNNAKTALVEASSKYDGQEGLEDAMILAAAASSEHVEADIKEITGGDDSTNVAFENSNGHDVDEVMGSIENSDEEEGANESGDAEVRNVSGKGCGAKAMQILEQLHAADKHPVALAKRARKRERRYGKCPTWDETYESLSSYLEDGTVVPTGKRYKFPRGDQDYNCGGRVNLKTVRKWIVNQRQAYRHRNEGQTSWLTDDRVKRLNDMGFIWKTREAPNMLSWEERFALLGAFAEEHGHCRPESIYNPDQSVKDSHQWCSTQRKQYRLLQEGKASKLTLARVEALEAIGLELAVAPKGKIHWRAKVEMLRLYKKKFGHNIVSRLYSDDNTLYYFVNDIKSQYRNRMAGKDRGLSDEKLEALTAIGFDFEEACATKAEGRRVHSKWDLTFDRRLEELQKWKEQHGTTLLKHNEGPPGLSTWVRKCRSHYRMFLKGEETSFLTAERFRRLEELGLEWQRRMPEPRVIPDTTIMRERLECTYNEEFDARIKELRVWRAKYGASHVPIGKKSVGNEKLANWVKKCRLDFRTFIQGGKTWLTQEKIDKLNCLEFVWETRSARS